MDIQSREKQFEEIKIQFEIKNQELKAEETFMRNKDSEIKM